MGLLHKDGLTNPAAIFEGLDAASQAMPLWDLFQAEILVDKSAFC